MNVYALKNYIINNPEYIELILERAGFHNIKYNKFKDEYRCSREEHTNPTSVRVKADNLSAICFSTHVKGDLITLVQSKLYTSFPETVKRIAQMIDFTSEEKQQEYKLPFGGFYKNIAKLRDEEPFSLEIYPESILNQYKIFPNKLFFEDGISHKVQREFKIGYDSVSTRITIPWFNEDGLVGVMGRLNKKYLNDDEIKYYPLYPFPKSQVLYGFIENYNSILEKEIVLISEAEKGTLQFASKGLRVGVSLGGSFISEVQANNIKSLFPKTIIVAMDEGLSEDHSREIALKLKSNKFYINKVAYIYDRNNLFLTKDSKLAPGDLPKSTIKQLIKHCTVWV